MICRPNGGVQVSLLYPGPTTKGNTVSAQSLILADQDYPLLNVFWTLLYLFLWILWIFLLFRIINDIFRSSDLGGSEQTGRALDRRDDAHGSWRIGIVQ